jgi:hypothetical protein
MHVSTFNPSILIRLLLSITQLMPSQWTKLRTAGLVGILLLIGVAIIGSILIYRRIRLISSSKHIIDSESDIPSESDYTPPNPVYQPGTVRRHTESSQTLYGWVQASHEKARLAKQEQCPSLQHGPGPVVDDTASSVYSGPTVLGAGTVARPETRESMGASSLREAVLRAAEPRREGNTENGTVEKKGSKYQKETTKRKKAEGKGVTSAYSGAWP